MEFQDAEIIYGFGLKTAANNKNLKWFCAPSAGIDFLLRPGVFANEDCSLTGKVEIMVKGIGHAAFNVKDMDRTIAFYEDSLGFKKAFDIQRPETGEPWIVYIYAGGGQFIELFYGATKENPYKDENIGFFHVCVAVDDIQDAWKRIVETGAPQDDLPKRGADHNWQCWTHDPDGIKIELMQLSGDSPQMKFIKSI